MQHSTVILAVEAMTLARYVDTELPLEERIAKVFEAAQTHSFTWLNSHGNLQEQDQVFRCCLYAIGKEATPEERERLTDNLRILRALGIALEGQVPVDWNQITPPKEDSHLPLMKLWHQARQKGG